MTDPKLREARIAEAKRRSNPCDPKDDYASLVAENLLDLIQADWRPEPEVDAVTLAAREWMKAWGFAQTDVDGGRCDAWHEVAAFRAGHAHALENCADVKRMDWLEGQAVDVYAPQNGILHRVFPTDNTTLRAKIDRAMGDGE